MFAKPASEQKIQRKLNIDKIDWTKTYRLGAEMTIDTYGRMFCFKLNHNMLFLNKVLYFGGLSDKNMFIF